MKFVTVSTCGTSILTNRASLENVRFLRENANRKDYGQEDFSKISGIIEEKRSKLLEAPIEEAKTLSAELNGFLNFYNSDIEKAKNDVHYLLHTDSFQGKAAADLIKEWGEQCGIKMTPVLIPRLNTASIEDFRAGINNLINWCSSVIPDYRSDGCRIIFNLVGGFKSLQGYMQTLGMFYADETVYIFEFGGELLRIPRMPVDFNAQAKQCVADNLELFRKMAVLGQTFPYETECKNRIPETMLNISAGQCMLSEWGNLIWSGMKPEIYRNGLLPPLSENIRYTDGMKNDIARFDGEQFRKLNDKIDELAKFIASGKTLNLNRLDYHSLKHKQEKYPMSNYEFDVWNEEHTRAFCHEEGNVIVIDGVNTL